MALVGPRPEQAHHPQIVERAALQPPAKVRPGIIVGP